MRKVERIVRRNNWRTQTHILVLTLSNWQDGRNLLVAIEYIIHSWAVWRNVTYYFWDRVQNEKQSTGKTQSQIVSWKQFKANLKMESDIGRWQKSKSTTSPQHWTLLIWAAVVLLYTLETSEDKLHPRIRTCCLLQGELRLLLKLTVSALQNPSGSIKLQLTIYVKQVFPLF